jgi:hypothetical protein
MYVACSFFEGFGLGVRQGGGVGLHESAREGVSRDVVLSGDIFDLNLLSKLDNNMR